MKSIESQFYDNIRQNKAINLHIWEVETILFKRLKADHQNSCLFNFLSITQSINPKIYLSSTAQVYGEFFFVCVCEW